MATKEKAIYALNTIAKRYPQGTASLFSGAGLRVRPTGHNIAVALTKGDITARQLYHKTLGTGFDDFNPLASVQTAYNASQSGSGSKTTNKEAGASKFENIVNGLLSTANQAADIYGKFKSPSAGDQPAIIDQGPASSPAKSMPWGLIAGGAGLVVVLIVVLFMLKK